MHDGGRWLVVCLTVLTALSPAVGAAPTPTAGVDDPADVVDPAVVESAGVASPGTLTGSGSAGPTAGCRERRHCGESPATDRGTADRTPAVTATLTVTRSNATAVRYEYSFSVSGAVSRFEVRQSPAATAVESEGFRRSRGGSGSDRYVWAGEDPTPRLTYVVDYRNWSSRWGSGIVHEDWLLAFTPRIAFAWRADGETTRLRGRSIRSTPGWNASAPDGVAAPGLFVYLGPHREVSRELAGERLRLVVPAAVEGGLGGYVDVLSNVSRQFDAGRDAPVLGAAVPAGYDAADPGVLVADLRPPGIARGNAFLAGVTYGPRLWIEEFVHTHQTFRPTARTRWLPDAIAVYYRRVYAYEYGGLSWVGLVESLTRPGNYTDDTLSDPSTWEDGATRYRKGPKVVAYLDWRIRELTGDRGFEAVQRRLNDVDGPVGLAEFRDAVAAVVGNHSLDGEIDRFVTSPAFPERVAFPVPEDLVHSRNRTASGSASATAPTTVSASTRVGKRAAGPTGRCPRRP